MTYQIHTPVHIIAYCHLRVRQVFFSSLVLLAVCSPGIFSHNTHAWETLNGNIDISCSQTDALLLACSYRLLVDGPPLGITAGIDDIPLQIDTHRAYPSPEGITSVLFLIDTSDPGRQDVVSMNAIHIETMLETVGDHHQLGLAGFDRDLTLAVPPGGTKVQIVAAAKALRATGLTTELYRNTLNAVEILSGIHADRKVIFLFSDGQAEDKAYFHQDVITAARKHGVIINSLGFPRSTALSTALQTLRRLSEDSGGSYVESDMRFALPESYLRSPFDNIDRGGQFIVNLEPASDRAGVSPLLTIRFETARWNIPVTVPVTLADRATSGYREISGPTDQNTAAATSARPLSSASETAVPARMDIWLWYGVPIVLLILVMLTLVLLFLLYRRQLPGSQSGMTTIKQARAAFAWLVSQDDQAQRYPVTNPTWRIGRSRDNEMTLNDSSISRRHAVLRRLKNGSFVITDLGSTNGVFINNRKVIEQQLEEGDIIELGDLFLRYTQHPLDYPPGENIAVLKTRTQMNAK